MCRAMGERGASPDVPLCGHGTVSAPPGGWFDQLVKRCGLRSFLGKVAGAGMSSHVMRN